MATYGVPPKELMLSLASEFAVERFLETGTHLGRTTAWAAAHFAEVVTIEASAELQEAAIEKRGRLSNVKWVLGDTRKVLAAEIARLESSAIVWLDSHWSGGRTYENEGQCPLLSEIAAVRTAEHDVYIFIDDARFFLSPPPPPHDSEQWPTLTDVVSALTSGDDPLDMLVLDDTFVAVPAFARDHVRRYAKNAAATIA